MLPQAPLLPPMPPDAELVATTVATTSTATTTVATTTVQSSSNSEKNKNSVQNNKENELYSRTLDKMPSFAPFFRCETNSDVRIEIDGKWYPAHRAILKSKIYNLTDQLIATSEFFHFYTVYFLVSSEKVW